MKHYKLIISGGDRGCSLSNETDHDSMSDYFPGIWAINLKHAVKYAKEYLAEGNTVSVTCYDNPEHYATANKVIKELGLKQELFPEVAALKQPGVTNGKPSTLAALKKFIQPGVKLRAINYGFTPEDYAAVNRCETQQERLAVYATQKRSVIGNRETVVLSAQSNAFTVEKTPGTGNKSWVYYEKASDWTFDNEGATKHDLGRHEPEKGIYIPTYRIEYL